MDLSHLSLCAFIAESRFVVIVVVLFFDCFDDLDALAWQGTVMLARVLVDLSTCPWLI